MYTHFYILQKKAAVLQDFLTKQPLEKTKKQ